MAAGRALFGGSLLGILAIDIGSGVGLDRDPTGADIAQGYRD